MRVRTDATRQRIVAVATELFLEHRYERTSMALVSKTLGGSKATLYGYFSSKEDLFLAVLKSEIAGIVERIFEPEPAPPAINKIREISRRYLQLRTAQRLDRLFRIVIALPDGSPIGNVFYEESLEPGCRRLCSVIEQMIAEGDLRAGNAWTMAMHLKGMVEQNFVERILLWTGYRITGEEIEKAAADAATAFFLIYGPEPLHSRG